MKGLINLIILTNSTIHNLTKQFGKVWGVGGNKIVLLLEEGKIASRWSLSLWVTRGMEGNMNIHKVVFLLFVL